MDSSYQTLTKRMESPGYWDNFAEFLIWNAENPGALQASLRKAIGEGSADYFQRKSPWHEVLDNSSLQDS